jgi:hypothetical protein
VMAELLTEEETRALYMKIHEAERESLRRRVEMMRLGVRLARATVIKWHDRKSRRPKMKCSSCLMNSLGR